MQTQEQKLNNLMHVMASLILKHQDEIKQILDESEEKEGLDETSPSFLSRLVWKVLFLI